MARCKGCGKESELALCQTCWDKTARKTPYRRNYSNQPKVNPNIRNLKCQACYKAKPQTWVKAKTEKGTEGDYKLCEDCVKILSHYEGNISRVRAMFVQRRPQFKSGWQSRKNWY